jgi:CBS-domain-containing membrane protein
MKIKEIIELLGCREVPKILEHESIKNSLLKMLKHPHTRLIYVVDEHNIYKGTISLGELIRHMFSDYAEPSFLTRTLVSTVTSETNQDIMNKRLITATIKDTVEDVITKMISAGIKEIAVVDVNQKLVTDITMLDLLNHYHLDRID